MTLPSGPIQTPVPAQAWENVHHVSNYYDFPLEGLADFNGAPHVFFFSDEVYRAAEEDPEEFDREVTYALYPANADLVAGLAEKHAIFERWHVAYAQDPENMKHHPALPEDRARYDALKALHDPQLQALRATSTDLLRAGNFAGNRRPVLPGQSRWQGFQVQWLAVSPASA